MDRYIVWPRGTSSERKAAFAAARVAGILRAGRDPVYATRAEANSVAAMLRNATGKVWDVTGCIYA